MTKVLMEFASIFSAQFPGIKTVEEVTKAFHNVVATVTNTKLLIKHGFMPADIGNKRVANLTKDLVVLGRAMELAFDPSVTYVAHSGQAIADVTGEVVKQKDATDELRESLEKVKEIMVKPEARTEAVKTTADAGLKYGENFQDIVNPTKEMLELQENAVNAARKAAEGKMSEADAQELVNEALGEQTERQKQISEALSTAIESTKKKIEQKKKEVEETFALATAEQVGSNAINRALETKKEIAKLEEDLRIATTSTVGAEKEVNEQLEKQAQARRDIDAAMQASGIGGPPSGPPGGPPVAAGGGDDPEEQKSTIQWITNKIKDVYEANRRVARAVNDQGEEYSRVKKKIDEIKKKIEGWNKTVKKVSKSIRAWGRNFLWLGRDITIFTSMAIGAAVKSTTMWAKFAEQVTLTRRVLARRADVGITEIPFDPGDMITGVGIMGDIMAASDAMAISISAGVMSYGHLIRAGYESGEALEVSSQAMILNRGSMISLADATDMMITIQKNFSKTTYDAARIADIMTVADQNAVASMSELQSGMAFASGTAARLGMSLQETAAAMVVLTNAGFSGSVAGRELRSVMNNLMQNAEDYGVKIQGAGGEMLPFDTMLGNVADRMNYFGTELERTQFLQELFGETNVSLVQALLKNRGELKKISDELDNSGGAAEDAADLMKKTLEYRLDQLRISFEKIQLAIGSGFSKALVGGEDFLANLADTMQMIIPLVETAAEAFGKGFVESLTFFVEIAQKVIGFALNIADALRLVKVEAQEMGDNVADTSSKVAFMGDILGKVAGFALIAGPAMMGIGMALEILSPIAFVAAGGMTVISAVISGIGAVASGAGAALGVVSGALGAIAVVLGLPVWVVVVIIAAAITMIVGVVIAFADEVEKLGHAVDQFLYPVLVALEYILNAVWHVIEPVIRTIIALVEILLKLGYIVGQVIVWIVQLLDFFKVWELLGFGVAVALGLIGVAIEILSIPLQIIAGLFEGIANVLDWIIGLIFGESPGLIPGLEALLGVLGAPLQLGLDAFATGLTYIGDVIGTVIDSLGELVTGAQQAFDKLTEGDLIGAAQSIGQGVINAGQSIVGGSLDAAQNVIGGIADSVSGLVCGFFGCSPGLIPAIEGANAAMEKFNSTSERMKSKNINVAASLSNTNSELEAMVGANLDTWNQDVVGKGREVVELGADTLRALQRILATEDTQWDWSESSPMIVSEGAKRKKKGYVFGGTPPR